MTAQAALASSLAWLDLLHTLLVRSAVSQALTSALSSPPPRAATGTSAGIQPCPDTHGILQRLLSCFDDITLATEAVDKAAESSHAESAPAEVDAALQVPHRAMGVVALMVQLQLRPLVRWLLARGGASAGPGLSQQLVTMLDAATGSAALGPASQLQAVSQARRCSHRHRCLR